MLGLQPLRGAWRGLAWRFGTNKAEGGMSDAHEHWDGQVPFSEEQHHTGPRAMTVPWLGGGECFSGVAFTGDAAFPPVSLD